MPGNPQTANLNGDYKMIGDHGTTGSSSTRRRSASRRGSGSGNTGRNQFRGPGYWNMDFSIFRAFPFGGGGKRVEFRAEFFNLTNTPKWGNPDGDVTSGNFGHTYTVGDGRTTRVAASARSASGCGSSSNRHSAEHHAGGTLVPPAFVCTDAIAACPRRSCILG